MNPIAIRLLCQQLVAPQFSDPAEVVGYMGAMQAQEYRMVRWAVGMRTRKPSHRAFKRAFDEGRATARVAPTIPQANACGKSKERSVFFFPILGV